MPATMSHCTVKTSASYPQPSINNQLNVHTNYVYVIEEWALDLLWMIDWERRQLRHSGSPMVEIHWICTLEIW